MHFHCLLWLKDAPENIEESIREAAKNQNFLLIEDIRSYFDQIINCVNPAKEKFTKDEQK